MKNLVTSLHSMKLDVQCYITFLKNQENYQKFMQDNSHGKRESYELAFFRSYFPELIKFIYLITFINLLGV